MQATPARARGRHFTVTPHQRSASPAWPAWPDTGLVYDALGPLASQGVHALAIVAKAPDEP